MDELRIRDGKDGMPPLSPVRLRTATKRMAALSPPPLDTLELCERLSTRVYRREAQVRRGFVSTLPSASGSPSAPPLADILRSGRGGAVRLKLYLSLLWIASGEPHEVEGAAQGWARVLGLDDPSGRGARQVRSGLHWLESRRLLAVDSQAGVGSVVTLLSDLGTGDPYRLPGIAVTEGRAAGQPAALEHIYVRLPASMWTQGWLHALTGPGLAMLLVLLDAQGARSGADVWFSQQVADQRYTLSEETRGRGLAELNAFELVRTSVAAVRGSDLGGSRTRHVHRLQLDRLDESPFE